MKNRFLPLLFLASLFFSCTSHDIVPAAIEHKDTVVMLSWQLVGDPSPDINANVADVVFANLAKQSGRLHWVPAEQRDSAIAQGANTPESLIKAAKAKYGAAVVVSVVENVLRADVSLVRGNERRRHIAYSTIRYRDGVTGNKLRAPSLLEACGQALAQASGDSSLLQAYPPQKLMAVASIAMPEAIAAEKPKIFESRIPVSFELVTYLTELLLTSKSAAVLDIDTRDTLYGRSNLYFVENYQDPTSLELSILSSIGVERVISGKMLPSIGGGTRLELTMSSLSKDQVGTIAKVQTVIAEDDKKSLLEAAKNALTELLLQK